MHLPFVMWPFLVLCFLVRQCTLAGLLGLKNKEKIDLENRRMLIVL